MKKQLSKSDIKDLNQRLHELYGLEEFFNKKDSITLVDKEFVVKDKQVIFFYQDRTILPHLKTLLKNNFLKQVVVDMGAIRFVVNGADIMRPGITRVDDGIQEEEYVAIIDENNKTPLAIGKTKFSTLALRGQEKGKSIINIHYVGDELWSLTF